MISETKPWDQLPDEPVEAYARFLIYRNLGSNRSLDAAFAAHNGNHAKGNKRLQAPGSWGAESSQYKWVERAREWDIETLSQVGTEAVAAMVAVVKQVAEKINAALKSKDIKPKTWREVLDSIDVISKCLPPEAVAAILADNGNQATEAESEE